MPHCSLAPIKTAVEWPFIDPQKPAKTFLVLFISTRTNFEASESWMLLKTVFCFQIFCSHIFLFTENCVYNGWSGVWWDNGVPSNEEEAQLFEHEKTEVQIWEEIQELFNPIPSNGVMDPQQKMWHLSYGCWVFRPFKSNFTPAAWTSPSIYLHSSGYMMCSSARSGQLPSGEATT